ncbi:histidinol-phosphate transaminase [Candidatus Oleimmundimicrobium sp.]|uniref:histidinol-phosphate transaminase n=1 Tax=Candidatus Oleimmundimicrobium sp. TaxID=3060597 RepID=UPI00272080A0|nr:histidinol-phosphate transaminase [Candidatus Oleimmundimicrobium sp.]MDO8885297.1 histidinol-phosphate transaminase [Candidatus Oleimmundimicrobium sp.]
MKNFLRSELDILKSYSPGKPISDVKRELGLKEVIKLASNESPYPPFPEAIEAIWSARNEAYRYPDSGCVELKNKLASFLDVLESNLMIGNGSNELLRLLAQVCLNPGDEVIMANPSFIVYPTVTKIMNGVCREIPLKNHKHDLVKILDAVNDKTKIVFICNPNNPTGTIVTKTEVEDFLRNVPDGVMVVFDEAYFEYVDNKNYPNGLDYFSEDKQIVVLRTFSKIYGLAGCRIGYGIASRSIVSAVNKIREPFNVNHLAQVAAMASLGCKNQVKERKKLNLEQKFYLYKAFDEMGLDYVKSEANFILVDVKKDSREVFDKLLYKGIIIRTGNIFGLDYEDYIRVTIGTPEENKKFIKALREVLSSR